MLRELTVSEVEFEADFTDPGFLLAGWQGFFGFTEHTDEPEHVIKERALAALNEVLRSTDVVLDRLRV